MKVYTKTGDNGTTGLFSGERVPKHHIRIKAYGTVDELNCWIGLIRSQDIKKEQGKELIKIQKNLMLIGSELANESSDLTIDLIQKDDVKDIELWIDRMTDELPVLRNFVIPGGHSCVANTHLARCVCRRAERFITELNDTSKTNPVIIFYINRLSDYLFTLSRKFAHDFNVEEIKWIP
ncbi:cob(I)yrinic acid a,c-diamide adenosyltransferase [Flavobacteriaceae bacterium]|uniref:cob(I)yrinic acid a,c-diamide adenosyltransferase n=1 Tax=Candidatus Arcticimaribacter forsetii TaxID=2820661 RepID=UPI0020776D57|nr:cob(I)yrinic acid a,c-diamide adenosyltransferase [Candidatus Arcticimaribacter forsetii]MDA8640553.1 cob(I)yrinic acid a,c-diamide adenosyltransferase [Flavobacteriaceae bacterium]MDB3981591.1 cob(I)yrinic acid a,c-diamide adenosyltransferase [bacterium]MDB4751695.1 cob(I)yrinic acid a,c-diamide adenosyltransferase [Flavobacteriaceae bacterium]